MNLKELTDLLVESSENFSQTKFIPWWVETEEYISYEYDMIEEKTIRDAECILTECGKEQLLTPVGNAGLTLFHLLVWHNFHDSVKKILLSGQVGREDIDTADSAGHGITPFLLACAQSNLSMVRLLLDHGANECRCDTRGMNAYHFLAYPVFQDDIPVTNSTCQEKSVTQRGEIARLLTCDVNQKDQDGLTPLERLLSTSYSASYTWPLTEVFLEKGAETHYVDADDNTLLMLAARNGHQTAEFQLMKHCPKLCNIASRNGMTPIRLAAEYSNQAMYIALKDHGAVPDSPMDLFPLEQVTDNLFADVGRDNGDSLDIALYLTEKMIRQVDPDDDDELGEITELLHNALVSDPQARVLDVCMETGIDFTMPIHYNGEVLCLRDRCLHPAYGMAVIKKLAGLGVDMEKAVVRGRTPVNVLASIKNGKEPFFTEAAAFFSRESMEQLDYSGKAAIHYAVENGHTGMLKIMAEKGVNINLTQDAPSQAGLTPLHLACANGRPDMVKLLMKAGADDTMQTLSGETPAHLVLKDGSSRNEKEPGEKAELLKELAHLDIPNEDGQTPLMLLNHTTGELLPLFLDRGADVNHVDRSGRTALMLCMDKDIIKELIRAGAWIDAADDAGNTALHYALKDDATGEARYLIRKGADYNRPNNMGETPAQIAVEKGYDTVLELMTDIQ